MGIFNWFKKKLKNEDKKTEELKAKIYTDKLTIGAKPCDYVLCDIMGKRTKCSLFSSSKDDFDEFSEEEIAEINWLIASGILNNDFVKKSILVYINKIYKAKENDFKERTDINMEIDLGCISVSLNSKNNPGNKVAFTGTTKCDEGHGISIAIKDKKFLSIQGEVEFDYRDNNWVEIK